jgi:hypothetical protein
MTKKELLTFFEGYYGEKYSGVVLDVMTAYLDEFPENYYKTIASVVVRRFSRVSNKIPDPAVIEKNFDEIYDSIPKPELSPEPEAIEVASPEEAAEYIKQMRQILSGKVTPLAESLDKVISHVMEENHETVF